MSQQKHMVRCAFNVALDACKRGGIEGVPLSLIEAQNVDGVWKIQIKMPEPDDLEIRGSVYLEKNGSYTAVVACIIRGLTTKYPYYWHQGWLKPSTRAA